VVAQGGASARLAIAARMARLAFSLARSGG